MLYEVIAVTPLKPQFFACEEGVDIDIETLAELTKCFVIMCNLVVPEKRLVAVMLIVVFEIRITSYNVCYTKLLR